ncbi:hypothetical protein KCP71_10135 [Salmonella enterica subsp. enterica]|nr:hypothetical protein KCP71_10135 [Salmonella enterica subsp. enterica]
MGKIGGIYCKNRAGRPRGIGELFGGAESCRSGRRWKKPPMTLPKFRVFRRRGETVPYLYQKHQNPSI